MTSSDRAETGFEAEDGVPATPWWAVGSMRALGQRAAWDGIGGAEVRLEFDNPAAADAVFEWLNALVAAARSGAGG